MFKIFENQEISDNETEEFVIKWRAKGETPYELKELVDLIYSKQEPISGFEDSIDVCGTGGDRLNTFNISTLTAIVVSALGLKVIKHSGRSSTSITGSIDILDREGLNIDARKDIAEDCLNKHHLMFVGSKKLRDTFGNVKKVCKKTGLPGFVNLIGPLSNPYLANYHLLGVSNPSWGKLLAETLKLLNKRNKALIVCSSVNEKGYMDELSFCGTNKIWKLENGLISEEKFEISKSLKEEIDITDLIVKDEDESKKAFEDVLKGIVKSKDLESKIKTVALNSGAALYLANKVPNIEKGYSNSLEVIRSGKVWEHFNDFRNFINRN